MLNFYKKKQLIIFFYNLKLLKILKKKKRLKILKKKKKLHFLKFRVKNYIKSSRLNFFYRKNIYKNIHLYFYIYIFSIKKTLLKKNISLYKLKKNCFKWNKFFKIKISKKFIIKMFKKLKNDKKKYRYYKKNRFKWKK